MACLFVALRGRYIILQAAGACGERPMPGLEISAAFFASALFLSLAPGPDNIFVLTQSALFGARAGLATTIGLVSGLCCHTLAVACGAAALLAASPAAFTTLKLAGAAYLCWLAWQSFHAGAIAGDSAKGVFPGYGALYRRGIVMNVTNPKVCLFFLAFLPQFCSPGQGAMFWQIVYFGILFMLAALAIFCPVAIMGGRLASWFNRSPQKQIFLHRAAGIIFLVLAIGLLMADAGNPA